MLHQMTKSLKLDDQKERFIIDNWMHSKELEKDSFDIILGDLVLRLICFNKQEIFLKRIVNFLKPKGFFITRIHFINNFLQKITSKEIINLTLALLDSGKKNKGKYIRNLLFIRLLDKNFSSNQLEMRKQSQIDINDYIKNNPKISLNKKMILKDTSKRFIGEIGFPFLFSQKKEEIEGKIKKFFNIREKLITKDYDDSEYFPIYILTPKL